MILYIIDDKNKSPTNTVDASDVQSKRGLAGTLDYEVVELLVIQ